MVRLVSIKNWLLYALLVIGAIGLILQVCAQATASPRLLIAAMCCTVVGIFLPLLIAVGRSRIRQLDTVELAQAMYRFDGVAKDHALEEIGRRAKRDPKANGIYERLWYERPTSTI